MSLSNPALAHSETCTPGAGRCRRLDVPPRKRMACLAAGSPEMRRTV
jgi:hypothetical protein